MQIIELHIPIRSGLDIDFPQHRSIPAPQLIVHLPDRDTPAPPNWLI